MAAGDVTLLRKRPLKTDMQREAADIPVKIVPRPSEIIAG